MMETQKRKEGFNMGLFDKMKEKGQQIISEQANTLKSKDIGGKNIGDMIKPLENAASKAKTNYDLGKSERILKVVSPKTFGTNTNVYIRRNKNDLFYFDKAYNEESTSYLFQSYEWAGPDIESTSVTKTTGKTKQKGRMGRALVGGVLLGPVGAVAGASGKRKGTVDTTSVTKNIENEKDSKAKLVFKEVETGNIKEITIVNNSSKNAEIVSFFQNINPDIPNADSILESMTNDVEGQSEKSVVEQLKELKELVDLDIISQEEFDVKKKELLGL